MDSLQPNTKYKSLGLKITKDRVSILNSMNHSNLSVIITDLYDVNGVQGTQVDMFIPYIKIIFF